MNRLALALVAIGASLAGPALAQSTGAPRGAPPTSPVASMNTTKPAATSSSSMVAHPEGTAGSKMMAPVNINTASESDLDAIPQIGPKRAKSIIAHRPYSSPADLVSKKAIGQGIFDKIKSHVTTS